LTTVLVTGSRGFVGRNLVRALEATGFTVETLEEEYFFATDWQSVLISRLEAVDPEGIFHVGACSDTLEQDVQLMMIRNFESTRIISDWCSKNKSALIYSSSAANYGTTGLFPSNLYGWSKYVAEQYVVSNSGIALRYFNVYGPGEEEKGTMASFIFQAFMKHLSGSEILLFPKEPRRDFIYIDDVVSANLHAFNNYHKLRKQFYEVSTGVANTFEEMIQNFGINFEYADESSIPKGYQFYTCGDRTKWMDGWSPRFNLSEGLRNYREYLDSNYRKLL
jgi:ADP-L-glycero-D-manno-heptose 6-epimerase